MASSINLLSALLRVARRAAAVAVVIVARCACDAVIAAAIGAVHMKGTVRGRGRNAGSGGKPSATRRLAS